ncbi:MAG: biotin--[acetyl-CoA-carboxylase] ligase [Actinomycetota bacterium]
MLSEPMLTDLLRDAGLDAPVRFEERTGSTQETARALAEAGAPAWTLVAAAHQEAGRGREGRSWSDAPGALLVSVVLRPALAAPSGGLVPLLAGAAMAEACEDVAGGAVVCRWPNDLLRDDGKVGGLLAESRLDGDRIDWIVLGIGVNVAASPVDVPESRALGSGDAATLLGAFLRRFPPMLADDPVGAVRARYVPRCATLARRVRARTASGVVEGDAVAIRDDGALVVATATGERAVTSGEVLHMEKDGGPADRSPP